MRLLKHIPTFDSEGTFVDEDSLTQTMLAQLVMSAPLARKYGMHGRNHTWPEGMSSRAPDLRSDTLMEHYAHTGQFRAPWYGTMRKDRRPYSK